MAAPRVVSIGSINLDVQVRADGWPATGSSGLASDCLLVGGGKAANVAYLVRKLGVDSQLVARVGDDPMAEHILMPLRGMGVDLSAVRTTNGCLSGVALIMTPPDGEKSILLAANANHMWEADDVRRVAQVVQGASLGSVVVVDFEITPQVAVQAIQTAHAAGLPVVLDPAPPSNVPQHVLSMVSYITPDAEEAKALTDIEVRDARSGLAAAEALRARGVEVALVKLAEGGCAAIGPDIRMVAHPEPVDAIDTTGAGDAFAGALAVALAERRGSVDALRWAVAASRVAVTRFGSQASYPDRAELEKNASRVTLRNA